MSERKEVWESLDWGKVKAAIESGDDAELLARAKLENPQRLRDMQRAYGERAEN